MPHRAAIGLSVLALLAGGAVSGCTPAGDPPAQQSVAQTSKITAYTAVFNTLMGGTPQVYGGLTDPAEAYLAADIASASPKDVIELELNPDWLPGALGELKAARAMRGDADMAAVDQAADQLISAIETIVRVEGGLQGYYEGRVYRQDGLARGRAAEPQLRKGYEDAISAMQAMEGALLVVQRRANDARITQLEARGNVAEASLLKAMRRADVMTTAIIAGDRSSADRAAGELEAALADMRQNKSRLRNKDDGDVYDLVIESLTGALASYRDSAPDSDITAQLVVPQYNNAVQFSSNMSLPL